jgi:colicin import membrane protein
VARPGKRYGSSWASWSLSILLHGAIVALVAGLWFWSQRSRPPQPITIEGSVMTSAELAAREVQQAQPVPEPEQLPVEPLPEPEPEPVPEEPPPPPEEDPAVLQAEAERVAEERRIAEAQQEAERKEREEAARQQADRERRERERAEQEKQERERQARERAERERREREQAEQDRREAALAAELAAEQQRQAIRGSAQARQYIDLIRTRIERNWFQFNSVRAGLVCEVRVTQVPGGTITGVQIGRCNGDDSVRASLEAAVHRSSPLPQPPDPALFERELTLTFRKD